LRLGANFSAAASATESALGTIGTLLQGRAEPLTVTHLEAVGQLIKETAMLSLSAFERAGRLH
jgi:hypothetical protein